MGVRAMFAGMSRPLRVVIVIVVVLGLASAVGGGLKTGAPNPADLPGPFAIQPIAVPVNELVFSPECVRNGPLIVVSAPCQVTLHSQLLPHELRMRAVVGSPQVVVVQKVHGQTASPLATPTFRPGDTIRVSAAGDGDVIIWISCAVPVSSSGACQLQVLD